MSATAELTQFPTNPSMLDERPPAYQPKPTLEVVSSPEDESLEEEIAIEIIFEQPAKPVERTQAVADALSACRHRQTGLPQLLQAKT